MAYDFSSFDTKVKEVREWLAKEYAAIHTGRATPAVLDGVRIEQYGSKQPLAHVANISPQDARTLVVTPWDKSIIKDIEKTIASSDLGLSAAVREDAIFVSFPELTHERKEQLVKVIKDKLEDARVSVRQERERVWEDIQKQEKGKEISEDDKFRFKEELQKCVEAANTELEQHAEKKEKEIMS